MKWTSEQESALLAEYNRIGYKQGEQWPFPDSQAQTPEDFLALLRTIPDGGGLGAYLAALQRRAARS